MQLSKFWSEKWGRKNLWTPEKIDKYFSKWEDHISPSRQVFDVFDHEDIAWLQNYMFRSHEEVKVKTSGSLLFKLQPHQTQVILDRLKPKIKKLVPDFEEDFCESNFYLTNGPYTIHIDSSEPGTCLDQYEGKIMPYKQLIIPIFVRKPQYEDSFDAGIIAFKQRAFRFGTIFCQGHREGSVTGSWEDIYSHKGIKFYHIDRGWEDYDDSKIFDKDFYQEYLTAVKGRWDTQPFPYENMKSLEVEGIYKYKPTSAVLIDACQLHCSVNYYNRTGVKNKCGLALNLFKEL